YDLQGHDRGRCGRGEGEAERVPVAGARRERRPDHGARATRGEDRAGRRRRRRARRAGARGIGPRGEHEAPKGLPRGAEARGRGERDRRAPRGASRGALAGVRFWDASAIAPLIASEPWSKESRELLRADAQMVVWWGSRIECL